MSPARVLGVSLGSSMQAEAAYVFSPRTPTHRYLRTRIAFRPAAQLDALQFKLAVTHAVRTMFGEVGVTSIPVDLLQFEPTTQEGVLRVPARRVSTRAQLQSRTRRAAIAPVITQPHT